MKDLKTLLEGLFDTDLVSQDAEFGSLYELSPAAHNNWISNDLNQLLRCFDKKKLAQQASKTKYKVDKNNSFVDFWGSSYKGLLDLLNVISGMPIQLILSAEYEGDNHSERISQNDKKKLKEYFDKFARKPKNLDIEIVKYPTKDFTVYAISFTEGIFSTTPNRLKLSFVEK